MLPSGCIFLDKECDLFIPNAYAIGLWALKSFIFIFISWLRYISREVESCRALGLNLDVSMFCCVRSGRLITPQFSYLLSEENNRTCLPHGIAVSDGGAGKVFITELSD